MCGQSCHALVQGLSDCPSGQLQQPLWGTAPGTPAATPRLRVEHFPSYARELNPDEGVWLLVKRDLANRRPDDLDELVDDVIPWIDGIRKSAAKLRGCILPSELASFLR